MWRSIEGETTNDEYVEVSSHPEVYDGVLTKKDRMGKRIKYDY